MGFSDRFKQWQNHTHYILNSILLLFEIAYFPTLFTTNIIITFIVFWAAIFLNDTIIHAIFWFAPKPIQWRD